MDGEPLLYSESDIVLQSGNYSVNAGDVPLNMQRDPHASRRQQRSKRWELNYHEAAIYLQEGSDNDKFRNHPGCLSALPTYLFTHNTFFYLLDLVASLGLLLLTVMEKPEVPGLKVHVGIHSSIELLCLMVIALELGMRFKWLGCRSFFKHARSAIKLIVLLVLIAESIAVLIRQTIHFRVTRAFRPIFLLDSYYCRGVRRFLRQIMQSMPPILDMLLLLLFFMLIFSILGFYIFSGIPNDQNFQTIEQSFISLFVLLTTANFPDVMMPAYAHNRWSVLFFVTYLAMELYFLMNLLLAVVYDVFSTLEKGKVKKLWLHKRTACCHAFKLLVSKQNCTGISLRHFSGVMSYFKPKLRRRDVYLVFKWLNTSQTGYLSREEFCCIYEVCDLRWKEKGAGLPWYTNLPNPVRKLFQGIHLLVSSRYFANFIYFVIAANFTTILVETIILSVNIEDKQLDPVVHHMGIKWYTIMFVTIYCLEALLKIVGLGPRGYFSSAWNIFDFLVTLSALIGIILQLVHSSFFYLVILRPFRLLRLFKMRRSFRDVLGTLFILLSRMTSLAVVMLVMYYFFGVIGMECFSVYDMRNCCVNSSVESQYTYENRTNTYGYYYLNNFDNILASYVTLFELTVVNNWFIIMEGYAVVATQWSRIYFMVFYIATMVVMTVVVAFILEAFLFRTQYRTKMHDHDTDDDAWMSVDMGLTDEELRMCMMKNLPFSGHYIEQSALGDTVDRPDSSSLEVTKYFRGYKLRGKMDFSLKMYADGIEEWIRESEAIHAESGVDIHNINESDTNVRLRNASLNDI